ncbi:DUF4856 domain-containing protein [Aquimarina sp. W85]|uniref:DUF4856 domain-containing protein n=1 Tax=Aquimarina rhodophyticola TaxID=3342246 RepID=UPI00366E8689
MKVLKLINLVCFSGVLLISSCSNDDDATGVTIQEPTTYAFERNGESTVSFGGQTTRIAMAGEIIGAFKNTALTEEALDAMFAHIEGESDFSETALNESDKNVRSKTAASKDYFSANSTAATAIKVEFDNLIKNQVALVFPNWSVEATPGNAGVLQEAGGGSNRYVDAKGLELNQIFAKGLIGALMVDQALNNYLSTAVLDEADNLLNNDNAVVEEGKNYTTMEHKWDEAYGYVYGASKTPATPNVNIVGDDKEGDDDFLSKYLSRVESDPDFSGIAVDIFNAFKLGRAAIVAKDYTIRDEQAEIIREKISEVIGVRAVYYLQQGKKLLESSTVDYAAVFHDLSEGYGFIYSLQFTRNPETNAPYLTRDEVDGLLDQMTGSTNGLWDVTPETLQTISVMIASKFNFTVEQAGS